MCISFAVMLPVGNPPNAIVFSYGHCQIKDMVSPGCPPCGPAAGLTGSTAASRSGLMGSSCPWTVSTQSGVVERVVLVKRFGVGP